MGARAYRYLCLHDPAPGCVVEVGSERGEGSTTWLAAYAHSHGLSFYTADVDPDVYERARRITDGARLCSGRELLRRVRRVSVAYLDGYDWIPPTARHEGWVREQVGRYLALGIEHSNEASEAEHLEEAHLVARKAAERCIVICDDTFYEDGWHGKGAKAVPYLEIEGFTVLDHQPAEEHSLGCAVLRRG